MHNHSPFYPSSLTPHLHLDLFIAGLHAKGHSVLIGGRWPGVAANLVFRMEGGGEAVSLCLLARAPACVNVPVCLFQGRRVTGSY